MTDIYFMDTFAGMGGLRIGVETALKEQGYNPICVKTSEIKSAALTTLATIYPDEEFNYTDITKVTTEDIPKIDGLIGGFPCFPAGVQITTEEGYKDIKDIQVGDMVLTHTNKFQKVLHTMQRETHGMYHLHARGSHHTSVTGEHPYYVRYFSEVMFKLGDPRWKEIKDFIGSEYIGYAINKKRSNPYKLTVKQAKNLGHLYTLGFNEAHHYLDELELKNEELKQLIRGSIGGIFPNFIINLPIKLLEPFFTTYLTSQNTGRGVVYAQNRDNAYILAQIILKVYKVAYTITFSGHDWEVDFSTETNTDWYYVDEQVWQRIDRVGYDPHHVETVYNFEVEEDNSYVVNNVIVHNCQTFSYAGKRMGLDDTRGTLFYELARIMKDKQPQWAIFENVKGLLTHDGGQTFETILHTFYSLGYHVSFQVMDAKYYGVANSRPRVFIVCHRDTEIQMRIPVQQTIPFSSIKETLPPEESEYTRKLLAKYTPEYLRGKKVTDKAKSKNIIHTWEFEARGPVNGTQIKIMEHLRDQYINGKGSKGSNYEVLASHFGDIKDDIEDLLTKRYIQYKEKEDEYRVLAGELSGHFTRFVDPRKPLPTLVATSLPHMGVVEDTGIRKVSLHEATRALGFPEGYKLPDTISETWAYDLLGNTVAPPVVKLIMDEIIKQSDIQATSDESVQTT